MNVMGKDGRDDFKDLAWVQLLIKPQNIYLEDQA